MKQDILDQIAHNEYVVSQHVTPEVQAAFDLLQPSQYHQWTLDAIAARLPKAERTKEDTSLYIGKVTLVHLYQARQELAHLLADELNG